jgi:hypothetical protein
MPNTRGAARGPAVLSSLFVFAFALFLTGCELSLQEPQGASEGGQRVAMSTVAAPLPQYDVAISAIDFDPPLKPGAVLNPARPVKLMAAVENKGSMQLSKLVVEARVSDQRGDFSAQGQVQVDKLSPGETRVVEFQGVAPVSGLPRSPSFKIKIDVDGAQLDPALPKPSRELVVKVTDQ